MKNIIILNCTLVCLLIPLTVVYVALDYSTPFLAAYAVWLIWAAIGNLIVARKSNPLVRLRAADRHDIFCKEVTVIIASVESAEHYADIFGKYEQNTSIQQAYTLLAERAGNNVAKATRYLLRYNHITSIKSNYMSDLAKDSAYITVQLDALNELVLKIEDSASEVDITYADDMLKALKEML